MTVRTTATAALLLAATACLPATDAPAADEPAAGVAAPEGVPDGAQPAIVERIVDGDTIVVTAETDGPIAAATPQRVRLLEIDTPETVHPDRPVGCGGPEAAAHLAQLIPAGSRVWLEHDRELTDRYDRHLRHVWTDDGRHTGLDLVSAGLADVVLYPPNDLHQQTLRDAEAAAQADGRGIHGPLCP